MNDFFELCRRGSSNALEAAIRGGAKVNSRNDEGATPLTLAAESNPNPEVILLLLKAGADVNTGDEEGDTPLHCAALSNPNPKVIEAYLGEEAHA